MANNNITIKGQSATCMYCNRSLSRKERLKIKGICSKCEKEIADEDISVSIFTELTGGMNEQLT